MMHLCTNCYLAIDIKVCGKVFCTKKSVYSALSDDTNL